MSKKRNNQNNTHYFNSEMTSKRYYRSDTVPNFKINQVKDTLRKSGYLGQITEISNTRVNTQNSFKVTLRNSNGISGKFLVNVATNQVTFKGTT